MRSLSLTRISFHSTISRARPLAFLESRVFLKPVGTQHLERKTYTSKHHQTSGRCVSQARVAHNYNLSSEKAKAGGSSVQGHHYYLGYRKSYLNTSRHTPKEGMCGKETCSHTLASPTQRIRHQNIQMPISFDIYF